MTENKELIKIDENQNWEEALNSEIWIAPLVDVYETEKDFILLANMPGVERKNIKLKLENDTLVIMGKVDCESANSRNYILKEKETGNYLRRFKIADTIDQSNIEAKFENGQLQVVLGKSEKIKPITIDIK